MSQAIGTQGYWSERYGRQMKQTVGNAAFDENALDEATRRIQNIMMPLFITYFADQVVLDLGCGWGRLSRMLVKAGAKRVFGIDIAEWPIERAKVEAPDAFFRVYNGVHIPVPDKAFGGILTWTVLQHIPPKEVAEVAEEIDRVLMPDGVLILYENCSACKDKDYLWFRSKAFYQALFMGYGVEYEDILTYIDGTNERHCLLVLRK